MDKITYAMAAGMKYVCEVDTEAGILFRWLNGEIIACALKWQIWAYWRRRWAGSSRCCPVPAGSMHWTSAI